VRRKRKRPPLHPHDQIDDYEAILLEQTRSHSGSWVDEVYRQHLIRWLADNARKLKLKQSRPPLRQAELRRRDAQARRQRREREAFYVQLRARYFIAVVSQSAKGRPLRKSHTREALLREAAEKFGIRSKDIDFEARIADFYDAVNHKWLEWASPKPQERILWAHRRGTTVPKITIHRRWSVDQATERAAEVAVRLIKRASAGMELPDVVKQLFADFGDDTVQRHLRNHFPKLHQLAARKQKPGRG
jgi:hypothetical protein